MLDMERHIERQRITTQLNALWEEYDAALRKRRNGDIDMPSMSDLDAILNRIRPLSTRESQLS